MIQNNTLNAKLSNNQLSKLKSGINIGTEITLNLSSNESLLNINITIKYYYHKLLFTNTQVSRICKAFANGSSATMKF